MTVRREVARSAALTAAALALAGFGSLWVARSTATTEAIRQAEEATVLLADAVVEPAIDRGLVEGNQMSVELFDEVVIDRVLGDQVLAMRIWDADGTVLYSDDLSGIGQSFPLGPDQREVLATGEPHAELSDLTAQEGADQSDFDELLEVYVAMTDPAGVPLLFETYQTTEGIAETARRILWDFAPVTVGSLLFLGIAGALVNWRLARTLQGAQEEREQLLQKSLLASERERRRIAADLHDGVVQELVGLTYVLDALAADETAPDRAAQLADAAHATRTSVRSLRSLLVEIYPPNLEQVGLGSALADLAAATESAGTRVAVSIDPAAPLTQQQTAALYRAAREGLSNVRRHARADRASVTVFAQPDRTAVLTVTDNGDGFEPADVPAEHMGLRLIGDLAEANGGLLELDSEPGRGTTLRVEVRP